MQSLVPSGVTPEGKPTREGPTVGTGQGCPGERRLLRGGVSLGRRVCCCSPPPLFFPSQSGFLEPMGECCFPLAVPALLLVGLLGRRGGSG